MRLKLGSLEILFIFIIQYFNRSRSSSSSVEPQKNTHVAPSKAAGSHEGSSSNKRVMFSGVSDGESPSESQVIRCIQTKIGFMTVACLL